MDVTRLIAEGLGWTFTVGVVGQQRTQRDQTLEYQNVVRIMQRIRAFTDMEASVEGGKGEKVLDKGLDSLLPA